MGGLVTTWPCSRQRRLKRDWSLSEPDDPSEPQKAQYDPHDHRRRTYSDKILRRAIDRQRKELLSAIARSLATDELVADQSTVVVSVEQETVHQAFCRLAARWRNETAHVSSIPDLVMHPSYQEIMRLPKNEVIPLILRELRDNGGFWYPALYALTDSNPVKTQDMGNVRKMTEAWLGWGRSEGWLLGV
jgi:hypothetical protein